MLCVVVCFCWFQKAPVIAPPPHSFLSFAGSYQQASPLGPQAATHSGGGPQTPLDAEDGEPQQTAHGARGRKPQGFPQGTNAPEGVFVGGDVGAGGTGDVRE